MEMIEKVARAIAGVDHALPEITSEHERDAIIDGIWSAYVPQAVAAIEALAANVSDEMVYQFIITEKALKGSTEVDPLYAAIAAALRAALNPAATP